MPFTPFHMGPALVIKVASGRHFSVLVFGIAQVAMDIEPLIGIIKGWTVLHGWTHTVAGATLIGIAVFLLARPLCNWILRRWNRELEYHKLHWLRSPEPVTRPAAASGAFIGTYSHVFFDSIMHADMLPLRPWSADNALLGLISIDALYLACFVAGLAGVAIWFALSHKSNNKRSP
ncbi:MAG: DUF4184 family protein [Betaproteobacteria bacterium]